MPIKRYAGLRWPLLALAAGLASMPALANPVVDERTSDVSLFYRLYDAAKGGPSATVLQRDYIEGGTDGVRRFVPDRILSGQALAAEVSKQPQIYAKARDCMAALPSMKAKLDGAFRRLAKLDPQGTYPPVTILIGRNNSGGTTGQSGVLIGLEVMCHAWWFQPNISERLYHLVAHEYGHVEQSPALDAREGKATVLEQSLVEGVAELVAKLISGEVSNVQLQRWTAGRVLEIDRRFLADADKTDKSAWLYNGPGTPAQPGDLGYWVGYRIAKAYYDRAKDKRAALRTLLDLNDARAILAESGWKPGQAD